MSLDYEAGRLGPLYHVLSSNLVLIKVLRGDFAEKMVKFDYPSWVAIDERVGPSRADLLQKVSICGELAQVILSKFAVVDKIQWICIPLALQKESFLEGLDRGFNYLL